MALPVEYTGVNLRAFGGKIIPDTWSVNHPLIKPRKHKGSVRTVWVRLLVFLLAVTT